MPKRKSGKPARSKKAKKTKLATPFGRVANDPSESPTPTEEEWKYMEVGGSFVHGGVSFRKGDDVILNDPDDDEDNEWLARIMSIRRRQGPKDAQEVWVLVRWYYSAKDLSDVPLQNLDTNGMSNNERLMSDREEVLRGECFQCVTWVYEYPEEDPDAIGIPEDAYFQRFTVKVQSGVVRPSPRQCVPTCKTLYHPQVTNPELSQAALAAFYHENAFLTRQPSPLELSADIMHFCPRSSCGRWFHEACLVPKYVEDERGFASSRVLRLLAADPDSDEPHPLFVKYLYSKPTRGKTGSECDSLIATLESLKKGPLDLPDCIIRVAARPIVRQANRGALSATGNARDVVLARRLLYQELSGGHSFLDEMLSRLSASWWQVESEYRDVWNALPTFRILASPYAPYWERAARSREDYVQPNFALRCPVCKGDFPVAI
ncbi:hypothetical protein BDW22DRAFT_1360219 [Trametopsis cervina]|nr:hypothetical protein BDW22DRAFT_1360219 [Trametopsis cervina]